LPDDADTTVGDAHLAYDRFIATGDALKHGILEQRVGVLRFDEIFGLDKDQTKAVSDHYPIYLELSGNKSDRTENGSDEEASGCGIMATLRNLFRRLRTRDNDYV